MSLQQALSTQRLLKVIAGIDNLDRDHVAMIVRAADAAGADAVDVAAQPELIRMVRSLTQKIVFASSVVPQELADAVAAGADVAEIGNFDALYKNGFYLTAEEVLTLVQETLALLPPGTPLSVTIPGHLTAEAQVQLAQQLQALGGVTLLQSEGASRVVGLDKTVQLVSREEKLELTLNNSRLLAGVVSLPIITASGIDVSSIAAAFQNGAAAVGVGTAISTLQTEAEMIEAIQALRAAMPSIPAISLAS